MCLTLNCSATKTDTCLENAPSHLPGVEEEEVAAAAAECPVIM